MPIDIDNIAEIEVDDSTIEGTGEVATPMKVKDSGISTAKIADNAVTTDKVASSAIETAKLANEAVTTTKIAGDAVTTEKINDLAVTTDKLADDSVTLAKVAQNGAADGQMLAWNGTGSVWEVVDAPTGGGGAATPVVATTSKSTLIGQSGNVSYTAPAALGSSASLAIDSWGDFDGITILVKTGEDYDNSANDYVLEITDASGDTNNWDPSDDDPAFDVYLPKIAVRDAGNAVLGSPQAAQYGIAEVAQDNAPSPAYSWAAGVLTVRFSGADFKAKSWNIITINK